MANANLLGMNQAWRLLALTNVLAGIGVGCKLHLFKNNIIFDPSTITLADVTEADFNTYTATTLTWDAPSVSDDGHEEVHSNRVTERPTDAVKPCDAYGFTVQSGAGVLYGGGTFDVGPLPMHVTLDSSMLTLVLRLDGSGYVSVIS